MGNTCCSVLRAPASVLLWTGAWWTDGGSWWLGFPACGALHAVDLWRFGPLVDRGP